MKKTLIILLVLAVFIPNICFAGPGGFWGSSDSTVISNTAFDMTSWDGVTTIAPTKNAIRDYFYLLSQGYPFLDANATPNAIGKLLFDNTVTGLTGGAFEYMDKDGNVCYLMSVKTLPTVTGTVPTYNSSTQAITFEAQSGGVTGTATRVLFFDGDGNPVGDAGFEYNSETNILSVEGGVNVGATASPAIILDDSDSASETTDYKLGVNATDTGAGTEDVDIAEQIQIASTLTTIRAVNADGNYSVGTASMPLQVGANTNIVGEKKHLKFTIIDPTAVKTTDAEVCLIPLTDAAITFTKVTVTLDADPTTEFTGDLAYCDAFIGQANSTVINALDTEAGVLVDDSLTSGAVASGKCVYLILGAIDAATTQVSIDAEYNY